MIAPVCVCVGISRNGNCWRNSLHRRLHGSHGEEEEEEATNTRKMKGESRPKVRMQDRNRIKVMYYEIGFFSKNVSTMHVFVCGRVGFSGIINHYFVFLLFICHFTELILF